MSESVPIGFEMESSGCIGAMRAAQRESEWWYCKKCDSHNPNRDNRCNICGKPRYRKRPTLPKATGD